MLSKPTIAVFGYGFVGQAVAKGFATVATILVRDPKFPSNSWSEIKQASYCFICVPTPMNVETGELDSSIVRKVVGEIYQECYFYNAESISPIVIIKSTVTPNVLTDLVRIFPKLKLVMNPEFLVEKTAIQDFENQDRIVLGGEPELCEQVATLYKQKWPAAQYFLGTLVGASLVKYMNNTYLALKLSFIVEWYKLAKASGLDGSEMHWLIEAFLGDKRVGRSHTRQPGPDGEFGWGGKCLPKDINAIMVFAKLLNTEMKTLEAAWQVNLSVRQTRDWEKIEGATSHGR